MSKNDKFRLVADLSDAPAPPPEAPRRRGPMAEAVAETADSLDERQAERARLMEKLKSDAAAYTAARADDRLDVLVPVDAIRTDRLERDRFDLDPESDDAEMRELKESIRTRGLQQSIKLFEEDGVYQLESGWRRLTAMRQLLAETGEARFGAIRAKVTPADGDLDAAYGRMVDENMVRKGVSHGELAVLAVRYARAPGTRAATVDEAVGLLFASAARAKRYHLRQIADLIDRVFDVLGDPSRIPRDLALKAADLVQAAPALADDLRARLEGAPRDAGSVATAVQAFVDAAGAAAAEAAAKTGPAPSGRKIEFRAGGYKCTVKGREVRLLSPHDLAEIDEARLQAALEAFRAALDDDA